MPRKRQKTRVQHLVDALDAAQQAGVSLANIDLRTTGVELRGTVKAARASQEELCQQLSDAIRKDAELLPGPAR